MSNYFLHMHTVSRDAETIIVMPQPDEVMQDNTKRVSYNEVGMLNQF